jgi:hypothetical protein
MIENEMLGCPIFRQPKLWDINISISQIKLFSGATVVPKMQEQHIDDDLMSLRILSNSNADEWRHRATCLLPHSHGLEIDTKIQKVGVVYCGVDLSSFMFESSGWASQLCLFCLRGR